MRLNWGHKLVIFGALFMLFIISLVTYMMRQPIELVESNYYEKGIRYQEVIDQQADADKLVKLELIPGQDAHMLITPADSVDAFKGTLYFYRPSDQASDFSVPVSCSAKQPFVFAVGNLDKGPWKAKLNWEDATGRHQLEHSFVF